MNPIPVFYSRAAFLRPRFHLDTDDNKIAITSALESVVEHNVSRFVQADEIEDSPHIKSSFVVGASTREPDVKTILFFTRRIHSKQSCLY